MILYFITFQSGDFYTQDSSFGWATIIAAIIAAFVVIIGYNIQKRNEQEVENRENSKEAYLKFLNDFTETNVIVKLEDEYLNSLSPASSNEEINKHKIESLKRKLQARNHILLYGSDSVIGAYLNYIKHLDNILQNQIEDEQEDYFQELVSECKKLSSKKLTILSPIFLLIIRLILATP